MVAAGACPECGADNAADARRCRICGRLLNASIPEVDPREKELPEHVRRVMERDLGITAPPPEQTYTPGATPVADDHSLLPPPLGAPGPTPAFVSSPPPPAGTGFGSLPPPPPADTPRSEAGFGSLPPPPADTPRSEPGFGSLPPPTDRSAVSYGAGSVAPPAAPLPAASVAPPWGDEVDDDVDIVIEARPRHETPPVFDDVVVDDEVFDPNALFRDLGREPPPEAAPPTRDPDELVLPPRETGPDPLWSIGEGQQQHLSTEEITRLTRQALREERLKRRPGFLDKVFKHENEDDDGGATPD